MTTMWHDGILSVTDWMLMGFGMLVFWALVVARIVWVIRSSAPALGVRGEMVSLANPAPLARNTRDILDERYARGELSEEKYRQRRDLLGAR